ncbi:MAG: tetratricopeptide repeat protein [Desulfobacterales bacterium]
MIGFLEKYRFLLIFVFLWTPLVSNFAGAAENRPPQISRAEQQILYEVSQSIEKKEYGKAEKQLKKQIKKHGKKVDYRFFFQLGNVYSLRDNAQKAFCAYKKAASRYNGDPALWQNMGKACYDLGRFSCAGKHMERAYQLQETKNPDLLYQAAGCRLMAGETERAYKLLKELCSKDDSVVNSDWLESLANVCMEMGKNTEAEKIVGRLLHHRPEELRWWKMMANFHIKSEAYDKAAAALKIHNQLAASKKDDVIHLGDLYMAAGVPLKAAQQYEKVLQWSRAIEDFKRLASAYLAAHRPEKAVSALSQALELEPDSGLWHMLGGIFYNQDKPEEAFNAFQKSFELDSQNGEAALLMGYSAIKAGLYDKAIDAFEKAKEFKNQEHQAFQGLTAALAASGVQRNRKMSGQTIMMESGR